MKSWKKAEYKALILAAQAGASFETICRMLSHHPARAVHQKLVAAGFGEIARQNAHQQKIATREERIQQACDLHKVGLTPGRIARVVGTSENNVRAWLRAAGVYQPQKTPTLVEGNGTMRSGEGLPPGHLKPWPETARFSSVSASVDPHRVATTMRPDPSYSSGVAEYGHV